MCAFLKLSAQSITRYGALSNGRRAPTLSSIRTKRADFKPDAAPRRVYHARSRTRTSRPSRTRAERRPVTRLRHLLFALALVAALPAVSGATVRNIVVMVCDGWGYNQLDAAAYWRGERAVYEGDDWIALGMSTYMYLQGWESPPYGGDGFVGVHGYDPDQAWSDWNYQQGFATDSAASATALSTGHKTYYGSIGMSAWAGPPAPLRHAFELAQSLGLATGVVTSVQSCHSTVAAFAVHNRSRTNFEAIAQALIGSDLDVVMGCGHPHYDADGEYDPGDPLIASDWQYVGGHIAWLDLVAGVAGGPEPWTLIEERADFQVLAHETRPLPDRVFGVAKAARTLQFLRSGMPAADSTEPPYAHPLLTGVPTLATMALGALNVLAQDPDGFCLMIEGGAVDWAGHGRVLGRLIEELEGFDAAVAAVVDWIESRSGWDETLLIVTGDHETGFLWGEGVEADEPETWFAPLVDNGPGVMPGFSFYTAAHSNQLIPLFARGPGVGRLLAAADGVDPVVGAYLDNTDVGRALFYLLDGTVVDAGLPQPIVSAASPALRAPRPNPFNPATTLDFELPRSGPAVLRVVDLQGRVVRTLADGWLGAGDHRLVWDGTDDAGRICPSGVYTGVLEADGDVASRKLVLVK